MQYKKVELGSYNIHLIKTDKFKTVNMQIIFSDEIKKDEITKRNFLADMLTYSTKKYNTKKLLATKSQDLYACNIYSTCYRIGKYYNTDMNLSFLNEKYTEEGMAKKCIEFFKEVIFNPNVTDNKFDSNSFQIIKNNMKMRIESLKENTKKYSIIKMLENMNSKEPYSFHSFGYIEDLEKITEENLYEYYQKFITKSNIEIFVIGNIDFTVFENLIKDNFTFNTYKKKKINPNIIHDKVRARAKTIIEEEDINQAKLTIGCKLQNLTDYEKSYVMTLYNFILGGDGESLLFQDVREKNSLCYYIDSVVNKVDNLLIITSGINRSNFKKTMSLIKKEMKKMALGQFDDKLVEQAKNRYISILDEMYDFPNQIITAYYASIILNTDLPEVRKEKIMTVTKQDIIKISKKIKIDTIYLLGGEE